MCIEKVFNTETTQTILDQCGYQQSLVQYSGEDLIIPKLSDGRTINGKTLKECCFTRLRRSKSMATEFNKVFLLSYYSYSYLSYNLTRI